MKWTEANIPDLTGKVAIVTGANSGIGYEAARALASKGATVIFACRNLKKGETAVAQTRDHYPPAKTDLMALDLADLSSVRAFVGQFRQKYDRLDLLINNAGVMAIPRRETADGFEMQFGTNHLGHFALTGLLFDLLQQSGAGRIINVSSTAHTMGKMNFDDLQRQQSYSKWEAYGQSKLANLLFTYELQRKLSASNSDVVAVAAHPGYAATNLQMVGPEMAGSGLEKWLMGLMNKVVAQDQTMGALPTLYAAVAPDVAGGDYIGPDGFREMRGYPTKVQSNSASHNETDAQQLWQASEELTGVTFPI